MNPMKYYVDASGNYLGGWDANPPAGAVEVPVAPDHAEQKWIDGEWLPHILPEEPLSLQDVASVRLIVDQDSWDVTGVERSKGVSGAMLIDTDLVWVFFDEPQSNTTYCVSPTDGVTKYEEYIEVTRPNLTDVKLLIQRVQ